MAESFYFEDHGGLDSDWPQHNKKIIYYLGLKLPTLTRILKSSHRNQPQDQIHHFTRQSIENAHSKGEPKGNLPRTLQR